MRTKHLLKMKTFKKLVLILTVTMVSFASTSCSKDDDVPKKESKLVGTWELTTFSANLEVFIDGKAAGTTIVTGKDYNTTLTLTENPNKATQVGAIPYTAVTNVNGLIIDSEDVFDGLIPANSTWTEKNNKIVFVDSEITFEVLESTETTLKYQFIIDGTGQGADGAIKGPYIFTYKKK